MPIPGLAISSSYRRDVRQWILTLAGFVARYPRLAPKLARAAWDERRCLRARETPEGSRTPGWEVSAANREGRLLARPRPLLGPAPRGLRRLPLDGACGALLYVPGGYRPERPARFALLLHGATSVALGALYLLLPFADAANLILLAPDAERRTWDRTRGQFGPDVAFVDRALEHVFSRYVLDAAHLAIGGFSDGASYALSLGLTNGDLFTRVIAFSPGFLAPGEQVGRPRVFVSHGTEDEILPVGASRRIVATLRASGYDVTYEEFVGPHIVPVAIAKSALRWFSE